MPLALCRPPEGTGEFLFSAWPATAEESALNAYMEQHNEISVEMRDWSTEKLMEYMSSIRNRFSIPAQFHDVSMTEAVRQQLTWINESRTRQHPFHWAHIAEKFPATFVKYAEGVTPVMSAEDTKRLIMATSIRGSR